MKPTKKQLIDRFLFISLNFDCLTNDAKKRSYDVMFDLIEQYARMRNASKSAVDAMNTTLLMHHSQTDWKA